VTCVTEMDSSCQFDNEFDQLLINLKPYIIKIPQQSGWLIFCLSHQSIHSTFESTDTAGLCFDSGFKDFFLPFIYH